MDDLNENYVADDPESTTISPAGAADPEDGGITADVKAQVRKIIADIKADKKFHEKAFQRMKRDMYLAAHGKDKSWGDSKYSANITGRHIRQKTASLYAKNPKAVARRRETLDFQVWDEDPQSLMMAMQMMQMAQAAAQQAITQENTVDEMGNPVASPEPQMPPGFEEAQQIIADFQQGTERRNFVKKFGKTLEVLFAKALRDQNPLDFKASMKQLVRRTCTTGVGYVELGFQRETGPRPGMTEKLADFRGRIDHLKRLAQEASEGEITDIDAEMAELTASLASLESEPEVVVREGLIFDFPASTKVIPDKLCKHIVGFVGSRHLTLEYDYSKAEVEEMFGVDLGDKYMPYTADGMRGDGVSGEVIDYDSDVQGELFNDKKDCSKSLVRVWKFFDKASGLVYYVCDGYEGYLREPAAPDVFVNDFWPVRAITFNAVENEDELFPPSDVGLLMDMQREYNRSRQGKREHRQAARPRWAYPTGALDATDVEQLKLSEPFDAIPMKLGQDQKIADVLQSIPVPGVDPNLYDVNEILSDMEVVAGAQRAKLGGLSSKTSATESAISASSSASDDSSNIDDLDAFLTWVTISSSQILRREMTPEQVTKIAGVGAVWFDETTQEIADDVFLEIEAGSSGKPNQAVELANFEKMMPFLIQMPGINPTWLARESLRRLDDKMDLTEALVEGLPSIMASNGMAQVSTGDPATDPNAQGGQGEKGGENNAPAAPGGPSGTGAAMGDNNSTPNVIRYGTNGQRMG